MGERYVPPEARGITAQSPESHKGWLRKRAEGAFRVLAFAAAAMGAERAAEAKSIPEKPAETEGIKFSERIEKNTDAGKVTYVQGERGIDDEGLKGKETVTGIEVFDEGNPAVKGDELTIKRSFYHYEGKDGRQEWDVKGTVSGSISGQENPFGTISGYPKSMREAADASMARTVANLDLQGFSLELKVQKSLRAIGKADTPEAQRALTQLQNQVRDFQKRHPDVPINSDVLAEVFATQASAK